MTAKKEKEKMIDSQKTEALKKLGIPNDQLSAVEAANAADKAKVDEAGIETKEKAEETTTMSEVEETAQEVSEPESTIPEETDPVEETDAKEVAPALGIQDIADAITLAVEPLVKQNQELVARVEGLENQVKALSADDAEKIAKEVSLTPRESLFAALGSAIGATEARVDGRTKEGKDGPKETPVQKEMNSIGIPVLANIDNWRETMQEINQ